MKWLRTLLDILFPNLCRACRQPSGDALLCPRCTQVLSSRGSLHCPVCNNRIPRAECGLPPLRSVCHPRSPYLLFSLTSYRNPVAQTLIQALKFAGRAEIADILGTLLGQVGHDVIGSCQVLVPIPLSPARLRERGFNQALLIGRAIQLQYPSLVIADAALVRSRHTQRQTDLHSWRERQRNVARCFSVVHPEVISGKTVALVDDVSTSGSTLRAAAEVLKKAGARRIVAVVVATAAH